MAAINYIVNHEVVESFLNKTYFPPSTYEWLLPKPSSDHIDILDSLAEKGKFPSIRELFPAVIMTVVFGVARLVLTWLIFKPLAINAMNLPNIDQEVNPEYEKFCKNLSASRVRLNDKKGKNEKRDEEWEMQRDKAIEDFCVAKKGEKERIRLYVRNWTKLQAQNKKIVKFVEAIWRFIFYGYFCYIGIRTLLYPKAAEWIWDTSLHWKGWPLQAPDVTPEMKFYYNVQLACYLHQIMWTEVSRSDAGQMILHHVATILLIFMSYLTQFTRIGTSILLVHDSADVFLESAKCFNYCKKGRPGAKWPSIGCDSLFGIFAVVFFVSRLVIYPYKHVYSLVVEAPRALGGVWVGYYAYASLLITLQLLHIFWFYLVAKMVYKLVTTGIEKDERSDDEDDDDEHDDDKGVGEGIAHKKNKEIGRIASKKKKNT